MSRENISFVIKGLSSLTLLGQILIVFLIVLLLLGYKKRNSVYKFISENSLLLSLVVASIATLGSLFLSEIAHFAPCKLCWWQRIFMYPQVILLGIGFWKNDSYIKIYSLPLLIIGFGIAVYHYLLQMYPTILPCTDEVASCAAKQFANYGYITVPLMAATAFGLMIVLLLFGSNNKK